MKIYPDPKLKLGRITNPAGTTVSTPFGPVTVPEVKKSHHKKPPVTKLGDTFTTLSGETMTRRQLSNLLARANRTIKKKIAEAPAKKAKHIKKVFEGGIAATGVYEPGADRYTLKGITDPGQLKRLEASARKALGSTLVSVRAAKAADEKRREKFEDLNVIRSGEGGKKDWETLKAIFETDTWKALRYSGWDPSDDILMNILAEANAAGMTNTPEQIEALQSVISLYGDAAKQGELDTSAPLPSATKPRESQTRQEAINSILARPKENRVRDMLRDISAALNGTYKPPAREE